MSRPSWFQKIYWSHFAKPVSERELAKYLLTHPVSSVLEIGVGDGSRLQRLAKLVQLEPGAQQLRYIGVDEFEAAQDGRHHLSLKQAHQLANQLGFKASLLPGTAPQAIARVAHKFGSSDLIIVDGGLDPDSPTSGELGSWMNRIAHSKSAIIACRQVGQPMKLVDTKLIDLQIVKAA